MQEEDRDTLMRDWPMLDIDRERMREEFGREEFDNMTLAEFNVACKQRTNELLDLANSLKGDK